MAIPLKRAKRRAQRARRRAHQHAPQAGVVVRLRPVYRLGDAKELAEKP